MPELTGTIALAAALFGCDRQGRPVEEFGLDKLAKGISSEGDVRMVMGQPETVWEEDGIRALQYPKGPEGVRTWEFTIDRSGKLQDYRQLLRGCYEPQKGPGSRHNGPSAALTPWRNSLLSRRRTLHLARSDDSQTPFRSS